HVSLSLLSPIYTLLSCLFLLCFTATPTSEIYTLSLHDALPILAALTGQENRESDFCVAIDKLDKIGKEKVLEELKEKGFDADALHKIDPIFNMQGGFEEKLAQTKAMLGNSDAGQKGVEELETVVSYLKDFGADLSHVDFDITLARGLSYYTGAIFEVKVNNVQIGSVSGGGRYDNLTGVFGLDGVSGVGFSFGVDRIYDVMQELRLFPENANVTAELMIVNFDEESQRHALPILSRLRNNGIKSEIYPEHSKLKKQMNYADKKGIPYVLMLGSEEIKSGHYTLKNMKTGEQGSYDLKGVIQTVKG